MTNSTLATVVTELATRHGDALALCSSRSPSSGRWDGLTYRRLGEAIDTVARGLLALGVGHGERVAILSETRPEWTVVGLAAISVGAVVVTVYPTNSAKECEWVLSDSGASVLICENTDQLDKIRSVRQRLPALRHLVAVDPALGTDVLSLDDLIVRGQPIPARQVAARVAAVAPTDHSMIVYTSGSTGNPKGCVLTHANWTGLNDSARDLLPVHPGEVVYLYLPLAHALAHIIQFNALERGATLHLFGGDITRVVDELRSVRPHHLPSVPRLFEKAYSMISAFVQRLPEPDRAEFHHAVEVGARVRAARLRGDRVDDALLAEFDDLDHRLLARVREIFGGRLNQATTGAAPIAPETLEFFQACGIDIYEGYGMTETTGVVATNTPADRRIGTVGRPIPGMQVRIAEDGEILVRGNVFKEYHNDPDATGETLRDGWLHTGDIGALDDGFLTITGRKKDLIITSGGKNISPSTIESDLRQSPWIANAVLYGDRRPHLVALIALDAAQVGAWVREHGADPDATDFSALPLVRSLIQRIVDEVNTQHSRPEQVRNFHILPEDFTLRDGEVTATHKLRRNVIVDRYRDTLDRLYA